MSPLKFLDAYQREDLRIFFGRETETDELYSKVRKSRLFVLYGLSGTGKTSVVRCGLANKFDPVDCLELYVRRENHILQSMRKCIQEAADTFIPHRTENIEALRLLYLETLRPIFLIFDQFEEIFISGNNPEINEFCQFLKVIQNDQTINANILLIVREEYMGQLEILERCAPNIYQNKQRLERMNSSTVVRVVEKILRFGNINWDDPGIPQAIVENAGAKNNLVELPYLQVYLDRLLKVVGSRAEMAPTVITNAHIRQVGKLEDLLGDFLEKQLAAISARQKDKDTEFGWRLLKKMITPEATKKLVTVQNLINDIFDQQEIDNANEQKLNAYLHQLRDSRIIRLMGDDQMEIAHDTLGSEIAKKRTPEELNILESERIVRSKYLSLKTKIKDDLTAEQIRYIRPHESKLKLEPEEKKFIRESIRRNRLKNTVAKVMATATISLLLGLTIWAMTERGKAQKATKAALSEKKSADSARTLAEKEQERAEDEQAKATLMANTLAIKSADLEDALNATKISEARATKSARRAEEKEDEALKSKALAEIASQAARDREQDAKREKGKTESINLALQSTLETDSVERVVKALKAYYLNAEFNNGRWTPEIVNALIYSNPRESVKELSPVKGQLVDLVDLGNALVSITDLGQFQAIDPLKGGGKILFNSPDFYYVNNSVQYSGVSGHIRVVDKQKTMYEFSTKNPTLNLINKKRSEVPDSVLLLKEGYMLTTDNIWKLQEGRYFSVIEFRDHQYGSTFTVGPKQTLGAGSTNGWLYVVHPTNNFSFRAQFQSPNTFIIDIGFDNRGEFIATGGTDSRFRLANIALMKEKFPVEWKFEAWVTAVLFVENMRVLVGTSDGKLFSLDYDQNRLAEECCKKLITQRLRENQLTMDTLVAKNCLEK